jgi:TonB-linked SusC/RagA family outer membrane protein
MKIFIFLFCVLTFGFSTEKGFSQNTKVRIASDGALSIEEVFDIIKKQTDYTFIYKSDLFENTPKVSVQKGRIRVNDLLKKFGTIGQFDFQFSDSGAIFLSKKKVPAAASRLLQQTVTGTVTDANGVPLSGANIVEKGTTNGVTADFDGNFSLQVTDGDAVLVVSYIGYATREVPVANQTTLNITLEESAAGLDEVVVVGYGTQKKKDLTGSITSLKQSEIENVPVTAVDALLQGRAPGVQVVQNSGAPGNANYIRIRGNNSLFGENRPLYVIDGVPMNEVTTNVLNSGGQLTTGNNDINPNDIASIEILKDASATAIYGSRGSNGVILITTKRGRTGDARFEFNTYAGFQSVWKKLDLLNAQQYEDFLVESITNENEFRDAGSQIAIPDEIRANGTQTDWQDEVFRTAPIQSYNLSMTAGNEKTNYFTSLSYFDQTGTVKGQDYERFTGRINIDHQATEKIKVGSNISVSFSENNRVYSDFDGRNPIGAAVIARPNIPIFTETGAYFQDQLTENFNPLQLTQEIPFTSSQKRVIGNLFVEYTPIESLTVRTSIGIDNLRDSQSLFVPNSLIGIEFAQATAAEYEELVWVSESTINYTNTFGEHDFSFLLGNTVQKSEESSLRAGGSQAGSNIVPTVNAISVPDLPNQSISNWGLMSFFGRLNYGYKDKYLLSGTLRADGSSRFPEGNKWGLFPSVSAGWRVSNEGFMEEVNAISDLKFRASYGVVGNQELGSNFPGRARYNTGSNYIGSFPGINIANIPNPELSWESTAQTNLGMDLALFENRLSITLDAYKKLTSDLIFQKNIPRTAGFFGVAEFFNLGEVENKGIDLAINTINFSGKFNWTTNFNINFNRNEIKSLPGFDPENPTATDFFIEQEGGFGTDGTRTVFRVGEPIGSFYGWIFDGVDPQTGGVQYVDTNGDGALGFDDRTILGNAQPLHTGGLSNNFFYEGIDLSVFMQWSYGNDVYNQTGAVLEQMSGYNNQSTDILNRWQQPGDITDIPRATFNDVTGRYVAGANNTEISDRFLEDGSFLRVKDITLGYRLPLNTVEKLGLQKLRFYVSVRNAFTFTDYSGFDPESQNTAAATSIGVDYLTQPVPRTIISGLDIQF